MNQDLRAALYSAAWVLLVLGVAELARRAGMARATTRKFVHIGIGSWIVPTYLLFETKLWAVAPPLGFVALNAASYRFGWIRSVEGGEQRNVGTILYPLSVALLLAWSFGSANAVFGAAGVMAMSYGDAAASLVGRRFGRNFYHAFGHRRSFEGSAAMFAASLAAMFVCFVWMGPRADGAVLLAVAATALAVTLLEAISIWGVDNLLVPLGGAGMLWWMLGAGA